MENKKEFNKNYGNEISLFGGIFFGFLGFKFLQFLGFGGWLYLASGTFFIFLACIGAIKRELEK